MNNEYREAGYVQAEAPEEYPPPEPPIAEELPWWKRYGPWLLGGAALLLSIIAVSKKK